MIRKGNTTLLHGFPKDYFAVDADRSNCLHATSSNALFYSHFVGNVIYHKFSHDDVCYWFSWKNVNAMSSDGRHYGVIFLENLSGHFYGLMTP